MGSTPNLLMLGGLSSNSSLQQQQQQLLLRGLSTPSLGGITPSLGGLNTINLAGLLNKVTSALELEQLKNIQRQNIRNLEKQQERLRKKERGKDRLGETLAHVQAARTWITSARDTSVGSWRVRMIVIS
jgi:hypothetical protein